MSFVICPSVWPFDHGSVMAAWTATRSRVMSLAKEAIMLLLAAKTQASNSLVAFVQIIAWNRSIRSRASTSRGTPVSMAAMVTVSDLLR